MKDLRYLGIKRRVSKEHNYDTLWYNGKTVRLGKGEPSELPADKSEFYDVSLGTVCTTGQCPFCFPAGTGVLTEDGIVNIDEIVTGMRVLSYNNVYGGTEFAEVTQIFSREYHGEMCRLRFGGARLVCTPNHPVYVVDGSGRGRYLPAGEIGGEMEATDGGLSLMVTNAPYACVSDFRVARDLHAYRNGDVVGFSTCHMCRIDKIETFSFDGTVYNIGVERNHSYFADGVLVHNCYVGANPDGVFYEDVCETWRKWMDTFHEQRVLAKDEDGVTMVTLTEKPYQIAVGSESEPTEHPEFCDFLKTVYESGVVPNYTTNGVLIAEDSELSERILEATRSYVDGVAVSFGNRNLRDKAERAIHKLEKHGDCAVLNIHHIISDRESVDDFVDAWRRYVKRVNYHILLPLMPHGRSVSGIEDGVFEYLEKVICENDIRNIGFGANFYDRLKTSRIRASLYPPESLSKNVLLKKDNIVITPSSFDLRPMKVITF